MRKILLLLVIITSFGEAKAQFVVGPDVGYAFGKFYNQPYAGLGIEYGYKRVRYGIFCDVLKSGHINQELPMYAKNTDGSLSYNGDYVNVYTKLMTINPGVSTKLYLGSNHAKKPYDGFYVALGASYKFVQYENTVSAYNTSKYVPADITLKGTVYYPFIDVAVGYDILTGDNGLLAFEIKGCSGANQTNNGNYIKPLLPPMLMIGLNYRFGKFNKDAKYW